MVLLLHYITKGGLLNIENSSYIYFAQYHIIQAFAIVAVNCYVLISGYFLVKSQFKIKKFLKLWRETIFYSITVYLILILLDLTNFNIKDLIKTIFPVITKQYWFITTYLVMYLLSPFLNKLIYSLDKYEYKKLLFIILMIFSVITILPSELLLDDTGGYGIIWFICLYLIGAYIRIHISDEKINKYHNIYLVIYILIALLIATTKLFIKYMCNKFGINDISGKITMYNQFAILLESLSLFLYFKSINIKNKYISKIVLAIAPLTFAVYLIHEQSVLRTVLYKEILHVEICYNNNYGIFITLGSVILIFMVCILIEYIREKLINLILAKNK